jgi:hypothetical protein
MTNAIEGIGTGMDFSDIRQKGFIEKIYYSSASASNAICLIAKANIKSFNEPYSAGLVSSRRYLRRNWNENILRERRRWRRTCLPLGTVPFPSSHG